MLLNPLLPREVHLYLTSKISEHVTITTMSPTYIRMIKLCLGMFCQIQIHVQNVCKVIEYKHSFGHTSISIKDRNIFRESRD